MNTISTLARAGLSAFSICLTGLSASHSPAAGAEVRLLSAAAMQSVLKQIASEYERITGQQLIIEYATMGAINERVLHGETADLVIGSTHSISNLAKKGRIDPQSQVQICKVGVGIVMPAGSKKLPVSSVDDFKRALLEARVVVYADPARGGAAGIHVERIIERLGLAEQLKPKTTYGAGGDVTEVTLAQGPGALGMTQISEIVEKDEAEFVGPLPNELQNYTGVAAGIPAGVKASEPVMTFLRFLSQPKAIAVMKAKGMEVE